MTTRTPQSICPFCLHTLDAATSAGHNGRPSAQGCVSLCAHCGNWLMFQEDLRIRKPTPEEFKQLMNNPYMQRIQETTQKWVRTRPKEKPC